MTVVVEMTADGNFDCYPEDELQDYGVCGYGATAQEAIDDFRECVVEARSAMAGEGLEAPDYELVFKYDVASFFSYFNVFNASKLAAMTGINKSLMSQYASGKRRASQVQYDKLRGGIEKLTKELAAATF